MRKTLTITIALALAGFAASPALALQGDLYSNGSGRCDPGDSPAPKSGDFPKGYQCIDDHAPFFPRAALTGPTKDVAQDVLMGTREVWVTPPTGAAPANGSPGHQVNGPNSSRSKAGGAGRH